uniref:Uncharacterized protein n=1 Tax=Opuntia streptacantha TaxID=393608 RepID=A0A7C8ZDN7_OPUST
MSSLSLDELEKLVCLLDLPILLKAFRNFRAPFVVATCETEVTGETGADFDNPFAPAEATFSTSESLDAEPSILSFFSVKYISAISPSSSIRCSISSRTF